MKRVLSLFVVIVTILCFAACTNTEDIEPATETPNHPQSTDAPNSNDSQKNYRLVALMERMDGGKEYDMTMEVLTAGMQVTIRTVVKGYNVYSDIRSPAGNTTVLILDEITYLLDPASKTYMQMQLPDDLTGQSGDLFDYDEANLPDITIGEVEVDAQKYYAETVTEDGETVSYLFEDDDLKYIVSSAEGMTSTAKVIRFQTGADASLLRIPDDYTGVNIAQ